MYIFTLEDYRRSDTSGHQSRTEECLDIFLPCLLYFSEVALTLHAMLAKYRDYKLSLAPLAYFWNYDVQALMFCLCLGGQR